MRWIRTNRRAGGVLALFALFFQLAIGLTHAHASAQLGEPQALVAVFASGPTDHAAQDDHRSHTPQGGAACDICVLLHVGSAAHVNEPPALATPFVVAAILRFSIPADQPAKLTRNFLPQSRAPPAA